MEFAVYEVLKGKNQIIRVYGHEEVLKNIKSIKKHSKLKNKLKSTKTIHSIAYYNKKADNFAFNMIKENHRKSNITLDKLKELYIDKINDTIDHLNRDSKKITLQDIEAKTIKIKTLDTNSNNVNGRLLSQTDSNSLKLSNTTKPIFKNESLTYSKYTYKEDSKMDKNIEGKIIKDCLNYYLDKLNLNSLTKISTYSETDIYYLSTRGDREIDMQLMELPDHEKHYFSKNSSMLNAMISLGFREVIGCNVHLIGTLFETLYYIACIQGNDEVRRKLYRALTATDIKKLTITNPN